MKIGCCLNMLRSQDDNIGIKYLPYLKEFGYDYVELPLAEIVEKAEEEFRQIKKSLQTLDIPCLATNNFFPPALRLTGNDVSMKKITDYLDIALHKAMELGAGTIVFGSSGAKNIPQGFSYNAAFEQITEVLQLVSAKAAPYPICIAIEPLNRKESNIILNLADALKLQKAVNRDNVRLLVDYYHFIMENEDIASLDAVADKIEHVHIAVTDSRVFPIDENYATSFPFLEKLKKMKYGKKISIEAFSANVPDDLKKGITFAKRFA